MLQNSNNVLLQLDIANQRCSYLEQQVLKEQDANITLQDKLNKYLTNQTDATVQKQLKIYDMLSDCINNLYFQVDLQESCLQSIKDSLNQLQVDFKHRNLFEDEAERFNSLVEQTIKLSAISIIQLPKIEYDTEIFDEKISIETQNQSIQKDFEFANIMEESLEDKIDKSIIKVQQKNINRLSNMIDLMKQEIQIQDSTKIPINNQIQDILLLKTRINKVQQQIDEVQQNKVIKSTVQSKQSDELLGFLANIRDKFNFQ